MTVKEIQKDLLSNKDFTYKEFQNTLIPMVDSKCIIGVRTPILRKFAKQLIKDENVDMFLKSLPHKYFDENQLQAFIISEIKDFDLCMKYLSSFLPYVDNWATCDQLSPKCFFQNHQKLIKSVFKWLKSKHIYTIRFGIGMLMKHFLDDDFDASYLKIVASVKNNDYYVKMMIAWYFATALAKQYDDAIKYIENDEFDMWIHNKIIQKSIESYRINDNEKLYLKSLRRKNI